MTTQAPSNVPFHRLRHDLAEVASTVGQAAAVTGRATVDAVRHPGTAAARARKASQALPMLWQTVKPALTGQVDWRREYAYTLGEQAFIYGFPYIHNARLRHRWVTQEPDTDTTPYAAVNHFWHGRRPFDASTRNVPYPNNDTLYSIAWVDLSTEPVVLSHPDMGERYFTFELVGITSDNYDYVGRRTTGPGAGDFALVGPGWTGELPDGVRRTATAPSPWILIWGRTLAEGEDDLPHVHALQRQYRLTPLHLFGRPGAGVPGHRDVLEPVEAAQDPLGPWKTLNAMLAENPPPRHHEILLRQFAQIGIGPGLDVEDQPEDVRQSLIRAAATGMSLLEQQMVSGDWARVVNGWQYPPPQIGRFGDDFLKRAADQSLVGDVNDPEEAVYLAHHHGPGCDTEGPGPFRLHFEPGGMPPVDAFWSLTVYDEDKRLVPNPVDRYSIGDRTRGLLFDHDGGLTIHLGAGSPGAEVESNWLPVPDSGTWTVVLRMYQPRSEVLDGRWTCPPVEPADRSRGGD
ncbi:DUF1254 domain-containing protein [Streptomyces sp. GC420]|uniref:DUF1254 domain-containing protein n=1 Tax=Streptomyces sp. GC420 TaxID=2697568 RepID=UPI001415251D|nr:DUF1254 domain-containing protein [Streptomyces sp. GC420]NBM19201.1 DUF1254 domain-containing protein [Streptomyces sp. GC420]